MLSLRRALVLSALPCVSFLPLLPLACGGSSSSSATDDAGPLVEAGPGDGASGSDGGSGGDGAAADGPSSEGAPDAAPDQDNGAPSTHYPAQHPPLPTLVNANKGP